MNERYVKEMEDLSSLVLGAVNYTSVYAPYVNWTCGLKTQFHQFQNYNRDCVLNPQFQPLYVRICVVPCVQQQFPLLVLWGDEEYLKGEVKNLKWIEQTWHCHLSLTECNKILLVKAVVQMMIAFSLFTHMAYPTNPRTRY